MCNVKFTGCARIMGAVLPGMLARGRGHLVINGSRSEFRGLRGPFAIRPRPGPLWEWAGRRRDAYPGSSGCYGIAPAIPAPLGPAMPAFCGKTGVAQVGIQGDQSPSAFGAVPAALAPFAQHRIFAKQGIAQLHPVEAGCSRGVTGQVDGQQRGNPDLDFIGEDSRFAAV